MSAEPNRMLFAGVGRAVITPPIGIRMMGYTVQECLAEAIQDELTATALVLSDGRQKVVIIACDILFIQSPHVERICERIGERLAIDASQVLINCSHTHLGPMLPGWNPEDAEQALLQQRYIEALEETLTGVAKMADLASQPARLGAGTGSAAIGVNRRERLDNGQVIIGHNLAGPVDHDVNVLRVDDLRGRPIASIMTAAAHTIVLGPKTNMLSPDYVGPARKVMELATGAPALFLQGAAGNVSPSCGIGTGGDEQLDDLHRIGNMLGGEALKTWSQIRTHNRHGPRRVVQSVAAISVRDYEATPAASVQHFGSVTRRRTLAMANLPARSEAEATLARHQEQLKQAERTPEQLGPIHVARRLVQWSQLVLDTIDQGEPVTRDLKLWACRINDIGIVAVNGEPFAELALEVKQNSPLKHTLFLGYSNGCLGYLPTPEAFAEGGMEVNESYQNYMLPARFTREWGPAVVQNALEMLRELS